MEILLDYKKIKTLLEEAEIEDAGYEAELLILHFYPELDRAALMTEREKNFYSEELYAAVKKRCERYPLQYIIGEWYFCNETYRVTPDCLIPRPETELIVLRAAELLPKGARFVDLCTGSGCIASSTLAMRRDCSAVAVDVFDPTLALAKENAEANGVGSRVEFVKCDVLSSDAAQRICRGELFDAILSNPPYIKSEDMKALDPELLHEPEAALDGGEDGLIFYRKIIENFASSLKPEGFMLFEAGYDTSGDVAQIARAAGFYAEVIKDLSGLDRMILIRK